MLYSREFFALFNSSTYNLIHPVQFILVSSLAFILSMILVSELKKLIKYRLLLFFVFFILLTCILEARLWSHYEVVEEGLFQVEFWKNTIENMAESIMYGPMLICLFFPYNVFIFVLSFFILKTNKIFDDEIN